MKAEKITGCKKLLSYLKVFESDLGRLDRLYLVERQVEVFQTGQANDLLGKLLQPVSAQLQLPVENQTTVRCTPFRAQIVPSPPSPKLAKLQVRFLRALEQELNAFQKRFYNFEHMCYVCYQLWSIDQNCFLTSSHHS